MTRSRSTVEQLLTHLRRDLRPLGWRRRRRVLAEIRDHVLSAVEDGQTESEAIQRVGDAHGALAGFPARRRTHRVALLAVPIAFLALAAPVSGPLVQNLGAGATPSQAATISPARQQRLAEEACVSAWNSVGNARWQLLARSSHAARAYVGVGYQTRRLPWKGKGTPLVPGPGSPLVVAGCGVRFMLSRVASPYQRGISIFAHKVAGTFRFYRTLRLRTRSAAPAENATVDPAGRLTLSAGALAPVCPSEKLGSRVLSVVAGRQKTVLAPDATTNVARGTHSFVVAIRNTGTVAITGAIANLELYGAAGPARPTWRSKPVTIARLHAGELVEVPFATPALGTTTRLVRATTAAIACETRLGDNSPVFRVRPS
jgi:hypothetical protein